MTGKELKKLLKDHKVNQSALARKLEMTPQALYERLKSENPAYSFVKRVLQAAGIPLPAELEIVPDGKAPVILETGDGYTTLKTRYTACIEENADLKGQVIALQAEILAMERSGHSRMSPGMEAGHSGQAL